MKLTIQKRTGEKKSEINRLRHIGEVPAVIYGARRKSERVSLKAADIKAVLRNLKPGRLPTTLFELQHGNEVCKAIVKDIQYHPTNYEILHIDFAIVTPDLPVTVNVPIICDGVAECAGIKLGGFLRQVRRSLKVSCLPDAIPAEFSIDIRNMQMLEQKRLSDLQIPEGVKPLVSLKEVVVVIGKRS